MFRQWVFDYRRITRASRQTSPSPGGCLDRVGAATYGHIVALLLLVSGGVALMVIVWTVVWRLQRSSRIHPPGPRRRGGNYGRPG